MKKRMTEESVLNVLDALQNISYTSIEVGEKLDYMSAETTRVLDIYSDFIGTENEESNDKAIYIEAESIMTQCENILNLLTDTKGSILKLLREIGGC